MTLHKVGEMFIAYTIKLCTSLNPVSWGQATLRMRTYLKSATQA